MHTERMTLEELQKFLADELASPEGVSDFSRAFTPLTDGLGLTSPPKREPPPAAPVPMSSVTAEPAPRPAPAASAVRPPSPVLDVFDMEPVPSPTMLRGPAPVELPDIDDGEDLEDPDELKPTEKLASDKSLSALMEGPAPFPKARPRKEPTLDAVPTTTQPPPVPMATFVRRCAALVFDQSLILGLWAVALAITSSVLAGKVALSGSELAHEFRSPLFLRFAALEFATLWLGYLALSLGILDMTLGMWVWSMRVKYLGREESRFPRKVFRILWSFLFFAPVLPVVLLLPRWKGRNLLDFLSGTALYRVMG